LRLDAGNTLIGCPELAAAGKPMDIDALHFVRPDGDWEANNRVAAVATS
jgi:hypothetical protein